MWVGGTTTTGDSALPLPPLLMRRRAAVTGHHDLTRPDPLGFSCLVVLATRYKTMY